MQKVGSSERIWRYERPDSPVTFETLARAMPTKTIVVLANSIKKRGRCLAGKEIIWNGREWEIGGWIRPVPDEAGSEISTTLLQQKAGEVKLLDILEIPLRRHVPTSDQPENWLLGDGKWNRSDSIQHADLASFADTPQLLWFSFNKYIAAGSAAARGMPESLALIKPEQFQNTRIYAEETSFGQEVKKRYRRETTLKYRGAWYQFDITDPAWEHRYCPVLPKLNEAAKQIVLRNPYDTYVCLSLTPEFHGRQYKLIAAFHEPPA